MSRDQALFRGVFLVRRFWGFQGTGLAVKSACVERMSVERMSCVAQPSIIEAPKNHCEEKVTFRCLFRSFAVHANGVHLDGDIGAVQLWRQTCACSSLRTIRISIASSPLR